MIQGASPLVQALLGGLLTWGLTALGSAAVFVPFHTQNKKLLDASLGFAAGVMTAASFWSLLAPGIERAEETMHKWAFLPIGCGFLAGAAFVYAADLVLPFLGFSSEDMVAAFLAKQELPETNPASTNRPSEKAFEEAKNRRQRSAESHGNHQPSEMHQLRASESSYRTATGELTVNTANDSASSPSSPSNRVRHRRVHTSSLSRASPNRLLEPPPVVLQAVGDVLQRLDDDVIDERSAQDADSARALCEQQALSWRRVLLLIIAITVHNVPEGLAVGVAFGAIGKAKSATFESAISLAIGIGIQNFPEGMAVSLPLVGFGYSRWRAFLYGQLSGMVEPLSAMFGAAIVTLAEPILPYALSFAAGAMIYVVFDDIVPEAQLHGNGRLASWTAIIGFIIMMSLDVSLG